MSDKDVLLNSSYWNVISEIQDGKRDNGESVNIHIYIPELYFSRMFCFRLSKSYSENLRSLKYFSNIIAFQWK